jgi:hypothetical protein
MPKPMFVWSGSAWVSVATEVESLATYATQSYAAAQPAMKMIVPTSVAVGSGSGAVDTNGAITFSGASSVSLNGVFSSTYDNYKIIINNLSISTSSQNVFIRLRNAGTDLSTATYNFGGVGVTTTTTTVAAISSNSAGDNEVFATTADTTIKSNLELETYYPYVAQPTSFYIRGTRNGFGDSISGYNTTASSYDSITIYPAANNITGTIRVYGYKN